MSRSGDHINPIKFAHMVHPKLHPYAIALVGIALLLLAAPAQAALTISDLRCEYLADPQGIGATQPRLSWILSAEGRGQRQTAYQVLVASSAAKLDRDDADLWNSGRVESNESLHVSHAGKPLTSNAECFWRVCVWDQDGKQSPWSKPARWSMGLLDKSDWHGKWIGLEGDYIPEYLSGANWIWFPEGEPQKSAPLGDRFFRRTIEIPKDRQITRARYLATADSQCKAFINGRDIGGRDNYRNVKDTDLTRSEEHTSEL